MARCSCPKPVSAGIASWLATTMVMRSNSPRLGRVRPWEIAYGRTTGPASRSSHRLSGCRAGCAMATLRPSRCPGVCPDRRGEVLTDPGDEHGHLVRDKPDIGLLIRQHGEARALAS